MLRNKPWSLLIDNEWRQASSGETFEVIDPSTEAPLAAIKPTSMPPSPPRAAPLIIPLGAA